MTVLDWRQLLSPYRRKDAGKDKTRNWRGGRTEHERDYDRILFSAPVRRLADKTQVFPLDKNDAVHTRLTHSHEVSNLARSIGTYLAFETDIFPEEVNPKRNVSAMLAASGLSHDLGNPPFGHQGEQSIQYWFKTNQEKTGLDKLDSEQSRDFLLFEGNAQTLRILTKLQIQADEFGLNVTTGTLAALMKYAVSANKADSSSSFAARKKPGFFQSERGVVQEIWEQTGLSEGTRHPFAFIMEACDDIAYSVIDLEDACRKSIVSFADLEDFLTASSDKDDEVATKVLQECRDRRSQFSGLDLSAAEGNDISMQFFRVAAIAEMIKEVTKTFAENIDTIMSAQFEGTLISNSRICDFCKQLKSFGKTHAYNHEAVRRIELDGHIAIMKVMDSLWDAISEREERDKLSSKRRSPLTRFVYSKVSENYRRVFEGDNNGLPIVYRELQLLADMISGMTDSYALNLAQELAEYGSS